jgi:hypothetical protein
MNNNNGTVGCIGLVLLVVIGLVYFGWARATESTVTINVTRLDDQAAGNGHQYLVFTKQGVFKDTDSVPFLKFNSSDLFNQLNVGATYKCRVNGARIPLFSSYRDPLSCTPAGG